MKKKRKSLVSLHKVYAPGLCRMWIFGGKNHGKIDGKNSFWKKKREGAAEGSQGPLRSGAGALKSTMGGKAESVRSMSWLARSV